jgi:hypothetical protein
MVIATFGFGASQFCAKLGKDQTVAITIPRQANQFCREPRIITYPPSLG